MRVERFTAPQRVGATGVEVFLVCFLVLFLLATAATGAQAKQARLFAGTFGAAANPAPFPANPYPLSGAESVAAEGTTGAVYVADLSSMRVEKFDSEGHFILMFGIDVNKTKVEEAGSTEAERNVCTLASGDVCQEGVRTQPADHRSPLEAPGIISVDNSGGPSHGDVYLSSDSDEANGSIDKFDSGGHLVTSWGQNGQLDGSAITSPPAPVAPGPFSRISGMTISPSGDLWVSEGLGGQSQNLKFDQTGQLIGGFPSFLPSQPGAIGQIAVDAGENAYFNSSSYARKFAPDGTSLGRITPTEEELKEFGGQASPAFQVTEVALDSGSGDLFVGGSTGLEPPKVASIRRFDSSCHPVAFTEEYEFEPGCQPAESFGAGVLGERFAGIGVDPVRHSVYATRGSQVVVFSYLTVPDVNTSNPVNPSQASLTLTGTINPSGVELNGGVEGCRFEWGETESYEHIVPCNETASEIGSGNAPVEVRADISGFDSTKTYHYRLVASNPNDVNGSVNEPSLGQDLTFGPPLIGPASPLEVTATGALVQAEVNPNGFETGIRIEYGTEAGVYDRSTQVVMAGPAAAPQGFDFHLQGLALATTYHYRVVAENTFAEGPDAAQGPDLTFTTQGTGASSLPDGRGWELVSPPNKLGANLYPISYAGVVQASPSGDSITYVANAPTEPLPPVNTQSSIQVLSGRGASGWDSRDIGPPREGATGTAHGHGSEVRYFSTDLSHVVVQPYGSLNPSLSVAATEATAFLRTNYPEGEPGSICVTSCFWPLVTGAEGFSNVSSGAEFGTGCSVALACGPEAYGVSPDASHVVIKSTVPLLEGAPAGSLYEWFEGGLRLISILAGGNPAPAGGSPGLGDEPGGVRNARNAISSDGSRIVWSEGQGSSKHHLYLRDVTREETIQLDAVKAGSGKGPVDPHFQIASADGSRIFFTDQQRLTSDAGAATGKLDLYECEVTEGEGGELECDLSDLSPEEMSESGDVMGVPGASEDGSYIYFIANGVLTGDEENERHEMAEPGACGKSNATLPATCNLYLRYGGTTKFITVLSDHDNPDWSRESSFGTNLAGLTARVSPSGRWLSFMSRRSLTGYDNRDAVNGSADQEVFLYDAAPGPAGAALVCASCSATGARPHGVPYRLLDVGNGGLAFGRVGFGSEDMIAANIPGWSGFAEIGGVHQPRYLSDSGRLFFNSSDALIPRDSNGVGDVYEYEPLGVGDCTTENADFAKAPGGCVGLISSGTAKEESVFLDASESGNDAFFLTNAQLSKRDIDTSRDVYEARVGGGEVEPTPPPPCEGDACQHPPPPPDDPTPSSLSFRGAGNASPRAKKAKHGRGAKRHGKKRKHHVKRGNKHRHGGAK